MKISIMLFTLAFIAVSTSAANLTLTGTILDKLTYPTDGNIVSTSVIDPVAKPTFLAKGTITLSPGFWAKTPTSGIGFQARIDTSPLPQAGDINIYILNPTFAVNQIGKYGYDGINNTMTYRGQVSIERSFTETDVPAFETPICWREGVIYVHHPISQKIGLFDPITGNKLSEFSCAPANGRWMSIDPGLIGDIVICNGGANYRVQRLPPHTVLTGSLDPWGSPGTINSKVNSSYFFVGGQIRTGSATNGGPLSHSSAGCKMAGSTYFFNPHLTTGQMIVGLNAVFKPAVTVTGSYLSLNSTVFWLQPGEVGSRSIAGSNQVPSIISAPWANPNPVVLPASTSVNVLAVDADNGPQPLTYTWSKVNGPGDVTFEPNGVEAAKSSQAGFSKAGSYVVKVVVSDGKDSCEGLLPITVSPPPEAVKSDSSF